MIWQKLNDISTNYVFGGTRFDVYDTDCSGIVCGACYKWIEINPFDLGFWTGGIWVSPLLETIWQGESPNLPWEIMREDDLIFTSTESIDFDTGNGSHVGFYTGNIEAPFLSHFCDGGPMITPVNGVYGGNERFFGVRRLKKLMSSVWDDTSYQEPFATGASMGTRIVYMDMFINQIKEMIENMPNEIVDKIIKEVIARIWEYNYEGTAPDGNMYNCIIQDRMMMQDVWQNRNRPKDSFEKVLVRLDEIEKKLDDIR